MIFDSLVTDIFEICQTVVRVQIQHINLKYTNISMATAA